MIIKWDGQRILQKGPDATFSPQPGSGIQFVLSTGGTHLPSKDVMHKACKRSSYMRQKGKYDNVKRNLCLDAWRKTDIYTFRLPHKVEIFVMAPISFMNMVQLFIKMPPQFNQTGFCGNFNGKAEDDIPAPECSHIKDPVYRAPCIRKSPGYFVDALDSFFSQERLWELSLMESPENSSATGDCVGDA